MTLPTANFHICVRCTPIPDTLTAFESYISTVESRTRRRTHPYPVPQCYPLHNDLHETIEFTNDTQGIDRTRKRDVLVMHSVAWSAPALSRAWDIPRSLRQVSEMVRSRQSGWQHSRPNESVTAQFLAATGFHGCCPMSFSRVSVLDTDIQKDHILTGISGWRLLVLSLRLSSQRHDTRGAENSN